MINLHLLEYLKDNNFGTAIDTDLFLELLPVGKTGIAIYSRGGESRTQNRVSSYQFDLYSRGSSNTTGYDKLEKIKTFFQDNYDTLCRLPIVTGVSNRIYKKCRFINIGNIENLGIDENDRVVYRLSAELIYEKQ